MKNTLKDILAFISKAEKLKREMRHSWLSDGRQESVAEHTWRMSLMALLLKDTLEIDIDICNVLKMIIIHDLVEIEAGDVSALDILRNPDIKSDKRSREMAAIENIKNGLGEIGEEIYELWNEFEEKQTNEAKYANALDKLEVQIQHNDAGAETWEEIEYKMVYMMDQHVAFNKNLQVFKDLIEEEAEEKMVASGIDIQSIKSSNF